jgi:hypothetical protein
VNAPAASARVSVIDQWRPHVVAAVPAWLLARIVVAMAYVAAEVLPDFLAPDRKALPSLKDGLFAWDGDWYRRLMEGGYSAVPDEGHRFFPLLPVVGRGVDAITSVGPYVMVVVTNLLALAAMAAVHRLVLTMTAQRTGRGAARAHALGDSNDAAAIAVHLAAFAPAAFVLVWLYAEAPFMLTVALCLDAALRDRWRAAGAWALVAALLRPMGVPLLVVGAVAVVARRTLAPWWLIAGPAIGGGLVLVHAQVATGDWWAPIRQQEPLRGDLVEPITRTVQAIGDLLSRSGSLDDGLHAPFAVGGVTLVVVAWRQLPTMLAAYATVVVAVALGAENLNSLERYIGSCVPLVVAAAFVLAGRRRLSDAVTHLSLVTMTLLAILAWSGVFVP